MQRGLVLACLVACSSGDERTTGTTEQFDTVCGAGPTVKGIDVSSYQGSVDWTKVAADGVKFAFIRASDGTGTNDADFAANWSKSRAAGVIRGAYQYFRPNEDVQAQAQLLISKMGTLEDDDLPPVIDVEAAGGLSASQVASKVKQWIEIVQTATGRTPIIYTGFYFWRDSVGDPNMSTSPLWHAQYTSATCPTIAPAWPDWTFWQYTSSGSISGISGNVDVNRFNGTLDQLKTTLTGPAPTCDAVPAKGGIVDDSSGCFAAGGPLAFIRLANATGEDGELRWTHTTDAASEANSGQWNLTLAEGGSYAVEVATPSSYAQSKQAKYVIHANGVDATATVDQSAVDGWQPLGTFTFAAGGDQFVHLADNTGEPSASNIQLVFDAVRLTRMDVPSDPGDPDPGTQEAPVPHDNGGCSSSGGGAGLVVALGALATRRRRRG